jgi:hypothetical protein
VLSCADLTSACIQVKPLELLTYQEVTALVETLLVPERYNQAIARDRFNGESLLAVTSTQDLIGELKMSLIHATKLFSRIHTWRASGVPLSLLAPAPAPAPAPVPAPVLNSLKQVRQTTKHYLENTTLKTLP